MHVHCIWRETGFMIIMTLVVNALLVNIWMCVL